MLYEVITGAGIRHPQDADETFVHDDPEPDHSGADRRSPETGRLRWGRFLHQANDVL